MVNTANTLIIFKNDNGYTLFSNLIKNKNNKTQWCKRIFFLSIIVKKNTKF